MTLLDLGQLPRHKFEPPTKPQGCWVHADPTCLCDVIVTTPVSAKHSPMFGELAERAVGGVSAETVYEWASILIGCHEQWLPMDKEAEEETITLKGWALLPEFNRLQLVRCYKTRVPWREAKVWVPSFFAKDDYRLVAKQYNVRLFTPSLHMKEGK